MATKYEEHPRLPPTEATIKVLFALSGNRCAFPGCSHSLVNDNGTVVSQIAHIKGVRPKAARFDPDAEPEVLRQPENLLILCYEHHVTTDDESIFTVQRMRDMKEVHEKRFGGVISGLRAELSDLTAGTIVRFPSTLTSYARVNDFDIDADAGFLADVRQELLALIDRLTVLTPDLRSVFSLVIERGTPTGDSLFEATTTELEQVLGLTTPQLGQLLGVLTRHELLHVGPEEREGYYDSVVWVTTRAPRDSQRFASPILSDIRHVAEQLGVSVRRLLVDLDWSPFD